MSINRKLLTLAFIGLAFVSTSNFYAKNESVKIKTAEEKTEQINQSEHHGFFDDDIEKEFLSNHFQEFKKIKQHMDKLFDDAISRLNQDTSFKDMFNNNHVANNLDMNLKNEKDQYIITMDLPNSQKNDVNVKVEDQRLTVSGNVKEQIETTDKNGKHFKQFSSSFTRSILLPSEVKPETLKTDFSNNKLKVTINKKNK